MQNKIKTKASLKQLKKMKKNITKIYTELAECANDKEKSELLKKGELKKNFEKFTEIIGSTKNNRNSKVNTSIEDIIVRFMAIEKITPNQDINAIKKLTDNIATEYINFTDINRYQGTHTTYTQLRNTFKEQELDKEFIKQQNKLYRDKLHSTLLYISSLRDKVAQIKQKSFYKKLTKKTQEEIDKILKNEKLDKIIKNDYIKDETGLPKLLKDSLQLAEEFKASIQSIKNESEYKQLQKEANIQKIRSELAKPFEKERIQKFVSGFINSLDKSINFLEKIARCLKTGIHAIKSINEEIANGLGKEYNITLKNKMTYINQELKNEYNKPQQGVLLSNFKKAITPLRKENLKNIFNTHKENVKGIFANIQKAFAPSRKKQLLKTLKKMLKVFNNNMKKADIIFDTSGSFPVNSTNLAKNEINELKEFTKNKNNTEKDLEEKIKILQEMDEKYEFRGTDGDEIKTRKKLPAMPIFLKENKKHGKSNKGPTTNEKKPKNKV